MNSSKYEAKLLSFQSGKSRRKTSDDAVIRNVSDITAYSTPAQISSFVGLKMKEFIERQLSDDKSIQGKR